MSDVLDELRTWIDELHSQYGDEDAGLQVLRAAEAEIERLRANCGEARECARQLWECVDEVPYARFGWRKRENMLIQMPWLERQEVADE